MLCRLPFAVFAVSALLIGSSVPADALAGRGHGCGCGHACVSYQTVEKTIMVPTTVMEQRTIQSVEYHPQVTEKIVTVMKRIPVTHEVTRDCTIMVRQTRTRTVSYMACKPVFKEVEQQCMVSVPHLVKKDGVRTFCRTVPVHETRLVCRDEGYWAEQPCGCGGCGDPHCGKCRRMGHCYACGGCGVRKVWVSNIVQEEVPVTTYKTELVQEPYTYHVTVYKQELQTRKVRVCEYQYEPKTRDITETIFVPKTVTKTFHVTSYKCVPEQVTKPCTVMVPHHVEKVINVPVCRMVPKTVLCKVPVYCGCGCY